MSTAAVSRSQLSVIAGSLFVLAILPYASAIGHGFVNYDDNLYVTQNRVVQQGLTIEGAEYAVTSVEGGNWHPITWLAHMLDCSLFGLRAGWHHLVSILLHAINVLLLWRVLMRMTGAVWRSALVAAVFAVHPLHVESVAWIAERKDVLSTLFALLAMSSYLDFIEWRERCKYAAMLAWFSVSLMCKPMFVTLPFVLLLLDYWPLRRWGWGNQPGDGAVIPLERATPGRLMGEKLPLLAIAAAFSVIAMISQRASETMPSLDRLPLESRITNSAVAYATYLWKIVAPYNLAVFYPHPRAWPAWREALSASALIVITIGCGLLRRRAPWLIVCWLVFLGMLVPVIGLVQVGMQSYADRYMYAPAIWLLVMVAWSLPVHRERKASKAAIAVSIVTVIALGLVAFHQVACWRDSRTLFEHAIAVTKDNFLAEQNLGNALESTGDVDAAMRHYRESIRVKPNYGPSHENVANVLIQKGLLDEALAELQTAIRLNPRSATAYNSVGVLLMSSKRPSDAEQALRRAVELDPDNLEAAGNLGAALLQLQRWSDAIPFLMRVARAFPQRVGVRTNLAAALANVGRRDEAVRELQEVLRINPQYASAQVMLRSLMQPAGVTSRP